MNDDEIREESKKWTRHTDAEWDDLSDEKIRRIEAQWKSDVDTKLDKLIATEEARAKKYDAFIETLIKRELDRAAMRKAVIEKTLSGLVWMAVIGLLSLAWSGAKQEVFGVVNALKGGR